MVPVTVAADWARAGGCGPVINKQAINVKRTGAAKQGRQREWVEACFWVMVKW